MRILHFYKTYVPDSYGGTQEFIYQLAQGTVHAGHDVDVLYLSKTGGMNARTGNHNSHSARLNFEIASTGFSTSVFRAFSRLAEDADVVHYHFPWPFMDVVHFATGLKKPTVVTYHSDIIRQRRLLKFYKPLMSRFLSSVDRIVATSPNYFATSEILNDFRAKVEVIPIGLDRSSYPKAATEDLSKWRTLVGEKFFLFVGMIRYYKGLHILLEALRGTRHRVVIVGAGPVENELREHAARLNLSNVVFVGIVSLEDKVALLELCLGIVFPSHLRSEAFGISLLEGAMFGKPMISSEIGTGTTFINVHGETGLVVPPEDPASFREAMDRLAGEPALVERLGLNALARYEDLFTASRMVSSYLKIYSDLLNR